VTMATLLTGIDQVLTAAAPGRAAEAA
jgi:hypothetical protein